MVVHEPGIKYDREILLTYHRARYYDANLGRFTSRDPIGIQDDINLYTYTANNPVNYVDRMGREKRLITDKLIVSIFDIALENTAGFNFLVFYKGTQGKGPFDIKRNSYIKTLADKNGGVINFNGIDVEPSNLGNLLAGFNMENSYLPSSFVRKKFMDIEIDNAKKEGYSNYAEEIAKYDEYTDEIWYDEGENIFSSYKTARTSSEKIEIISKAIEKVNPEYYKRSQTEKEKREYYKNLLINK